MTATELHAWIETRSLSHRQAAELLAISINQLRKMLYGVQPVDPQTERIVELLSGRPRVARAYRRPLHA